jgi:hypothetical protein
MAPNGAGSVRGARPQSGTLVHRMAVGWVKAGTDGQGIGPLRRGSGAKQSTMATITQAREHRGVNHSIGSPKRWVRTLAILGEGSAANGLGTAPRSHTSERPSRDRFCLQAT